MMKHVDALVVDVLCGPAADLKGHKPAVQVVKTNSTPLSMCTCVCNRAAAVVCLCVTVHAR